MNLSIPKQKIAEISSNPGVYLFYGAKKEILYVGKATNLRSRVRSYFRGLKRSDLSRPQRPKEVGPLYFSRPIEMMIHEVADIKTIETDSVLEALILESNLIKKHQPKYNAMGKDDKSFCYFVITQEEWPRVLIMRETDLGNKYKYVIPSLSRNLIRSSRRFAPQDDIKKGKIFGPYVSKKQMEIALKIVRKIFPFHSSRQKTEKGCLDFQIGTCPGPYAGAISKEDYRKNIRGIRMILEGKKKNLVKKLEKEMGELAKKHEFEKAGEARNKIFALKHIRDVALISNNRDEALPRLYGDAEKDVRTEAYDISNISGQYAVGSMVVFKNNEPDKSQYRKFKIKTIEGSDDVGMMREVLLRRFNNDWPLPDFILLDGGQGHLNMGATVLESLELKIPLGAVAKGVTRKIFNFKFLISKQFSISKFPNEIKNIIKDRKLVWRIMSEAHRFAIGYHRKIRKKNFI